MLQKAFSVAPLITRWRQFMQPV